MLLKLSLNFTLYQDFRREVVDLDDEEEASKYDEDFSTVADAADGDEDSTENVENVQQGEKEKVTIYCTLEDWKLFWYHNVGKTLKKKKIEWWYLRRKVNEFDWKMCFKWYNILFLKM